MPTKYMFPFHNGVLLPPPALQTCRYQPYFFSVWTSAVPLDPKGLATRNDDDMLTDRTCRWSNCGSNCPSGFSAVARSDGAPSEMMWDHTHCNGNGNSVFCCSSNVQQPTCKWRGHKKSGKCDGACIAGEAEVWSLKYGCKSGHQSACCSSTPSVAAYRDCRWEGDEPNCR